MADRSEFLNSMLKRGPNKRKIKPAENNELLALALGVDDEESEDDEDFEVHSEDEEGSFSESEDEGNKLQTQEDNSQARSESDADSGESSIDSSPGKSRTIEEVLKKPLPMTNIEDQVMDDSLKISIAVDSLRLLICGICLGDSSDEDDEIVECDNCGICVHESCYGISTDDDDTDTDSDKTSDTDSSTEPWFCDACKSGIVPECELCPNLGGIFKETLRGQWVHLVCSLYTPGVTFDVPEKLEGVVLVDMHHSRWGAKECNLCEDVNLSRTGVCIGCDAGLCKTFFHATCFPLNEHRVLALKRQLKLEKMHAQRKGLLSELPEEDDEDVADPLYAHCKLHLDKNIAKKKRQAYLTYISHVKKNEKLVIDEERKSRVETSLKLARETYSQQKSERTPPPAPKQKVSRSILSSPSVFRHLLKKAELLGYITAESKLTNSFGNTRRKWHVPASLTVEFVNYFYDRSSRMETMKKRLEDLSTNNKDLQEEEKALRKQYQEISETTKDLASRCETVKEKYFHLHDLLCRLNETDFALPEYLEKIKSKSKKGIVQSEELKLSVCSKCEKTENQHLMVECDTCHSFYHLACVDPPLTRMPKKSKQMLWQCTDCDSSSSEDEDTKIDPNDDTPLSASRQKRSIKEPSKFVPGRDPDEKIRKRKKKRSLSKLVNVKSDQVKVKSEQPKVRVRRAVKIKKPKLIDVRSDCSTCGQAGDNSNLVRCDECKLCFHFICLDPPSKSNPKPKGYSWYCTDCDETPDEESDEDMEKEKDDTSLNANQTDDTIVTRDVIEMEV